GRDQLLDGVHDFVHQAKLERLARLVPLALQQDVQQRALDTQQAYGPDHTTATGQQAQRHLGQADLAALDVGRDAVMRRERDLEAAAERGAVDRRDDRLAELLDAAHLALHQAGRLGELDRVLRLRLDQVVQVATGEERLLRGRDDDAGDVVLLRFQPVDDDAERLAEV